MFETKPVGRTRVVCTNISCMLRRRATSSRTREALGIKVGESTPDGRIFLKKRRGMPRGLLRRADDDGRPHVHENLTPAKVDEILDDLQVERSMACLGRAAGA
jgi:NADH-quinone oxidoreductase subunit E